MRKVLIAVGVAGIGLAAMPAHADPCDDVRTSMEKGDLTRARQQLDACPDDDRLRTKLGRVLQAKNYSPIGIATKPAGVAVTVDARPDLVLHGGEDVWLPPGTYTFTAGNMATTVTVKHGDYAVVLLEVPGAAPAPRNGAIDFSDEGGGTVVNGPPPKIVHPSLLPDRYRKALASKGSVDSGLDDRDPRVERDDDAPVDLDRARVGVLVGAGNGTSPSTGWRPSTVIDLRVLARSRFHGGWALAGELGWSHRGTSRVDHSASSTLQQVVLPVLVQRRIERSSIAFGAAAGAQLEVRLDQSFAGAPIGRVGGSVIGGFTAEALEHIPLYAEFRLEYGLGTVGDNRHEVVASGHFALVFP